MTESIISIGLVGNSSYIHSPCIVFSRYTIQIVVGVAGDRSIGICFCGYIAPVVIGIAGSLAIWKYLRYELIVTVVYITRSITIGISDLHEIPHQIIALEDCLVCSCLCFYLATVVIGVVGWDTAWISDSRYLIE